jgi:hypothetical protein
LHRGQFLIEKVIHMRASLDLFALQDQQLANFLEGKTQFLGFLNESEVIDILTPEEPKAAFGARGPFEQTRLLVKAYSVHSESGLLRQSADLQPQRHP